MHFDLLAIAIFAALSLAAASLALLVARYLFPADEIRPPRVLRGFSGVTRRYLFREGYLLSPIDPNDAFLDADVDRSRAFDDLTRSLSCLSDEVPGKLATLAARGDPFRLTCFLGEDALTLSGHKDRDTLHVILAPAEAGAGREAVDSAVLDALEREVEDLRDALDHSSVLVWKQTHEGAIEWANRAYFEAGTDDEQRPGAMTWPIAHVFDAAQLQSLSAGETCRLSPARADGADRATKPCFEITCFRRPDQSRVFMAVPINRLLAAEEALGHFVQTLSKTFAQLPIGLAVFDRKRELVLFNPSLTTLSTLSPRFLSGRPTLTEFLDALRDQHRVPEPKNYRHWRDEIARIERGAEVDAFQEFWTLPGGESWRVIGRPHPDGAVAFMFEDVSSEMTLTRSFRGQIDLFQSVLDRLPEAVAVFSGSGELVLKNAGFDDLWGIRAADSSGSADVLSAWQERIVRGSALTALSRVASGTAARKDWDAALPLRNGSSLSCQVTSLPGGYLMVQFKDVDADTQSPLFDALTHDTEGYEVAEAPSAFDPPASPHDNPKQEAG